MGLSGDLSALIEMSGAISDTGGSEVVVTPILDSGTKIATISVDDTSKDLYAPDPVSVTQIQSTGTKIATISVGATDTDLYAPSGGGGGSTVSVTQIQSTGTKIATITVDNVGTDLYAPSGGGGGSTVSYTKEYTGGTTVGTITIDGVSSTIDAPGGAVYTTPYSGGDTLGTITSGLGSYTVTKPYNEYTAQLSAGNTSVTISNAKIHTYSTIDVYTSEFGVTPTNIVISEGSIVLSFTARQSALSVKVRCY